MNKTLTKLKLIFMQKISCSQVQLEICDMIFSFVCYPSDLFRTRKKKKEKKKKNQREYWPCSNSMQTFFYSVIQFKSLSRLFKLV